MTTIKQGEIGEGSYFYLDMEVVEVLINGKLTGWIEENDIFGEVALISNDIRAADIVPNHTVNLYVLSSKSFQNLCDKHEDLRLRTEHLSTMKVDKATTA